MGSATRARIAVALAAVLAACGGGRSAPAAGTPDGGAPGSGGTGAPGSGGDGGAAPGGGSPGGSDGGTGSGEAGGASRWTSIVSTAELDDVVALATAGDGTIAWAATSSGDFRHDALRLGKLGTDGRAQWTRSYPFAGPDKSFWLAATPLGNLFVGVGGNCFDFGCRYGVDLGGGPIVGGALVKLGPDGGFLWSRDLGDHGFGAAADGTGRALAVHGSQVDPRSPAVEALEQFQADGSSGYSAPGLRGAAGFRVDAQGNALVFGYATGGEPAIAGEPRSAFHGNWLVKLDPAGHFLWGVDVGQATVEAVGASAAGTVVAAGTVRGPPLVWGTDTVGTGGDGVLAVAEADGRPRFARALPAMHGPRLGVDPEGRAALAGPAPGQCPGMVVRKWGLDGNQLWERRFPPGGGCIAAAPLAVTVASDHSVVVGGVFSGTADFGEGPVAADGAGDGFVLDLAP